MGDLLKKTAPPIEMKMQADLIADALVRELRAGAPGIGWALAPGLFLGFLAMGFVVSVCVGICWLVLVVIII